MNRLQPVLLAASISLAAVLGGCVAYPAYSPYPVYGYRSPYYYGGYGGGWHEGGWRGGWHEEHEGGWRR